MDHELFVPGVPVPQGSKRVGRNKATGRAVLIEANKALPAWRAAVTFAWRNSGHPTITGPVDVDLTFYLPRPHGHYGTGRNHNRVRPSALAAVPAVPPDADKLERAVNDALTKAGAWDDDARIIDTTRRKRYADPHPVGVHITIRPHQEHTP